MLQLTHLCIYNMCKFYVHVLNKLHVYIQSDSSKAGIQVWAPSPIQHKCIYNLLICSKGNDTVTATTHFVRGATVKKGKKTNT
jgi:hypothetical protein